MTTPDFEKARKVLEQFVHLMEDKKSYSLEIIIFSEYIEEILPSLSLALNVLGNLEKIEKAEWAKVNTLDPDSEEYICQYKKAQITSNIIQTLLAEMGKGGT